jgi:hypothetical protein
VGDVARPIGCLSHLDVGWDFAAWREGVVAHIVIVPAAGQIAQEKGEDFQSPSTF